MMSDKERLAREEERNKNQDRDINDLYGKWEEIVKCIRRIERRQWIGMGEQAGIAVLLGFVLAKLFGGI
ncbi:hypothetical protein Ngar_c03650 [Candidatus Nitrososphaera gargensis Ga9.2]|uniref:Uncharacterized protein n=1 Tax=Nitrososphaera gargensis (strain Ga9.2) TaxID=1237085 RepID=K0IEU2_NITGG|nr:hypothetical protein [Candidatus Nitrososphaera gargensis]AFU57282.1 hypothetical protein Ngar_c03340 [Candidatus Nitrososphaera gargensis Ga9.2]AFU57313.1 hypothetical protein Ngar_c03650 [Candidatus Nitrososphaera gargensis Ga9.2]